MRVYMIHEIGTAYYYCGRTRYRVQQEYASSYWGAKGLEKVCKVFANIREPTWEIIAYDLLFDYVLSE
ncbi:hypothetical protein LCGC14_2751100, partial [marine sediment metagenome]